MLGGQAQLTSDLWVKLDAIDRLGIVRNGCILGVPRRRNRVETLGQLGQLITVGHPHLHGALEALEKAVDVRVDALGRQLSGAILAVDTCHDIVLVHAVGELLLAVADAQDGNVQFKEGRVGVGCGRVVDGVGTAAEDEAYGLVLQLRELGCAREHLRVDIELAETADDPAMLLSVTNFVENILLRTGFGIFLS